MRYKAAITFSFTEQAAVSLHNRIIEHKMTQIITFDKQKYFTNYTLDELEAVCGKNFYRANRQFLINRETVQEALQYFARKLVVKLKIEGKHEIIISKSKVSEFLSWLRS